MIKNQKISACLITLFLLGCISPQENTKNATARADTSELSTVIARGGYILRVDGEKVGGIFSRESEVMVSPGIRKITFASNAVNAVGSVCFEAKKGKTYAAEASANRIMKNNILQNVVEFDISDTALHESVARRCPE